MKRFYSMTIVVVLALLVTACSPVEPITIPNGDVTVDVTSISFPSIGGKRTIQVTTKDFAEWEARSDISWIKLSEPDFETGTITVTVDEANQVDDLNGKVTIYCGPRGIATIDVSQKGQGIVYDRRSTTRMNLHGDIAELSYYFNPQFAFEINKYMLKNLKFDENGMLTYFEHELRINAQVFRFENTLTYNQNNQLTKLYTYSPNGYVEQGVHWEYTTDFEYGNHGKYIETDRVIELMESQYTYCQFKAWMPRMIKNLTGIKVHNTMLNGFDGRKFESVFTVNGNTGKSTVTFAQQGVKYEQDLSSYEFENNFTKSVKFVGSFVGILADFELLYTVNPKSGHIAKWQKLTTIFDIESGLISEMVYGDDWANSRLSVTDILEDYIMTVEMNSNNDIVFMENVSNYRLSGEFEYKYDEHNNWTRIIGHELNIPTLTSLDQTRTIVYR